MACKLTLEQRIARLERLLNTNKSVKNEEYFDYDIDELSDWVESYVNDELAADYRWDRDGDGSDFEEGFERLANRQAPEMIREIMKECALDLEVPAKELRKYRDYITDVAAVAAEGILETYREYKESKSRSFKNKRCESRTSKNRNFGKR